MFSSIELEKLMSYLYFDSFVENPSYLKADSKAPV